MVSLGQKIKLFRVDKGISQFELETSLGMGYGSLSRIESNHTTPTRSTLKKIAKYLKLNDRKFDYLIGSRETAPSEQDINEAVEDINELILSKEILLILRDDHFRICAASQAIKDVFDITDEVWKEKCYLRNIISMMLDESLPFSKMFDERYNHEAEQYLQTILYGFSFEMSFMRLEDDYNEVLDDIKKHPLASKIFTRMVKTNNRPKYYLITQRELKFMKDNKIYELIFYTEVLPDSNRFSFIHFIPKPPTFPLSLK
jgi:transcriptional regulator with XRE-family HTH domain